jgi:predicted dehydrogenase
MLDIGLIGIGADWDKRYRPVLNRLRTRLRVRAIYAPVANRGDSVATEFQATWSPGLCALLERPDLKAVLVLDSGWTAHLPTQLACSLGKPVFVAGASAIGPRAIADLATQAAESGTTVMPDLPLRYLPATLRLRELLATKLGRPRLLRLELTAPFDPKQDPKQEQRLQARLVELLDWCRAIVGTLPVSATMSNHGTGGRNGQAATNGHVHPHADDPAQSLFQVLFAKPARGGEGTKVEIHRKGEGTLLSTEPLLAELRVECEGGWAEIRETHAIRWQTTGGEATIESLADERDDLELMLDHFSRRVVGGLVPVPTFEDIRDAWQLLEGLDSQSA